MMFFRFGSEKNAVNNCTFVSTTGADSIFKGGRGETDFGPGKEASGGTEAEKFIALACAHPSLCVH